jgi:hypothetical protein
MLWQSIIWHNESVAEPTIPWRSVRFPACGSLERKPSRKQNGL